MSLAVVLTALPVEYLAVRAYLTDLEEQVHPQGTIYEWGKFATDSQVWDIGIVEIGAGNPGAALEAERAIAYFNPEIILFVGVAGGIRDVAIGDVVASTKVYGYESGKAEEVFKPRPEIGLAAYGLEQRARAEARKGDWLRRIAVTEVVPRVFVAPIAAGEKVVASTESEVYKFLRSNYGDAVAVEMEGFGFLEAARANQRVSAIVIRGISDLIDKKADADEGGSQEKASRNASAFAFELLSKLNSESKRSSEPIQEPTVSTMNSQQKQRLDQKQIEEEERQLNQLEDMLNLTEGNSPTSQEEAQVSNNTIELPIPTLQKEKHEFITSFINVNSSKFIVSKNNEGFSYIERLDQDTTIELVEIPAGKYTQGAGEDYGREVNIASFYIGKYPVTQKQWEFVAKLPLINLSISPNPSMFGDDENLPVEQISWDRAIEFCDRLSYRTNRKYRLLSESEWEYACRGKTGREDIFHFGKTIDAEVSNYDGTSVDGNGRKGEYRKQTTPVDMFKCANEYGLYDMHGNVFEWCQDDWQNNYQDAPKDGSPKIITGSRMKVIRGGSWSSKATECRSSARASRRSDISFSDVGFRLAININ
jgi:formylglycine-generating enzyme required for sulfatase activity/nucleoside phosphorylase